MAHGANERRKKIADAIFSKDQADVELGQRVKDKEKQLKKRKKIK